MAIGCRPVPVFCRESGLFHNVLAAFGDNIG